MEEHWKTIYQTKDTTQVSWYQDYPKTSLDLIAKTGIEKSRPLLDLGGGDSRLVDVLLASGYTNVTVVDIAPFALQKAQSRLGAQAQHIRWVAANVLHLPDDLQVDIWHDRATFHFLRKPEDIARYAGNAARRINPYGYLILGTFALRGPQKCSGLPVSRYSEESIKQVFCSDFEPIRSFEEEHTTPNQSTQLFLWSIFKRVAKSEQSVDTAPYYQCSICKLHFREKSIQQQCEAWCRTHASCHLQIASQSMEAQEMHTNRNQTASL